MKYKDVVSSLLQDTVDGPYYQRNERSNKIQMVIHGCISVKLSVIKRVHNRGGTGGRHRGGGTGGYTGEQ